MPRKLATLDEDGNLVPFRYGGGTPNRPASDTVICMTFDMEGNEIPMPFFGGTEGGIIPEVVSQIAQIPLNTADRHAHTLVEKVIDLPPNPVDGLIYMVEQGSFTATAGTTPTIGEETTIYLNLLKPPEGNTAVAILNIRGDTGTDVFGCSWPEDATMIVGANIPAFVAMSENGGYVLLCPREEFTDDEDRSFLKDVLYRLDLLTEEITTIEHSGYLALPQTTLEFLDGAEAYISTAPWTWAPLLYSSFGGVWSTSKVVDARFTPQPFRMPTLLSVGDPYILEMFEYSMLLYRAGIFETPSWSQTIAMFIYGITNTTFEEDILIPFNTPNEPGCVSSALAETLTSLGRLEGIIGDDTTMTIALAAYDPVLKVWSGRIGAKNEENLSYQEPMLRTGVPVTWAEEEV